MKKFLELVAEDLLKTYGNNLAKVKLVLPGKRARLFMNQYLAKQSDKPVWAPQYQTIDELFLELSPYRKAEQIETVCLLYQIYSKLVENPEPLDEFYAWGEIILSDFDDIDKHLAPAEKIFANVYDIHAIHENYLTEEQEKALQEFFSNFSIEGNTEIKERFLRLWKIMPRLYAKLKEELQQRGYLYSGALYREVVESLGGTLEKGKSDAARQQQLEEKIGDNVYAFVGFNVVDECEASLFRLIGEEHTRFYWDYDEMYMQKKEGQSAWEAGLFLSQNLAPFPNRLPRECFDNLRHLKDITFIATSTDNAQARYLPVWIQEQLTKEENDTAIVLCDEHQLQPVLHALPEDTPRHINVTMGFPLTDTPIFSFLSVISAMQIDGWEANSKRFRNTFKEKVMRHPYHKLLSTDIFEHQPDNLALLNYLQGIVTELATHYAQKEKQEDVYDQLYGEALFQTHKILNRFIKLTEDGTLDVHPITLRRLLRNVLNTTSIPFHGEPAIGMQVMGLMETRNLDFSHLLMMNVGEGTMPKKSNDNSLIPFNLRNAFGLTTFRHRISVFAYYFFRLLQRAEHVTLLYNENSSGVKNNEMSRFMRQLMAETDLPIKHIRLNPKNELKNETKPIWAEKTPEIIQELRERYKASSLSPTAINGYLNCPLQFYFKYVAGMYVQQQEAEGITAAEMGTIFHDAAQSFYDELAKKYHTDTFTADMLRPALEHKDTQIAKHINMGEHDSKSGLPLIIKKVILEYLCQLIRYDLKHTPFTVYKKEEAYYLDIEVDGKDDEKIKLKIGGRIDRLDKGDGKYIVIDYKTGGLAEPIASVEDIFVHKAKNAGYYFQTILYSLAVSHQHGHCAVQPTLFYVHRAYDAEGYDSSLAIKEGRNAPEPILDVRNIEEEFMTRLKDKLAELFNPDIRFTQTDNEQKCRYCDFRKLCGKKIKEY